MVAVTTILESFIRWERHHSSTVTNEVYNHV
jgi:hypothetical protein